MHELGALDLGAEDAADWDVFADLPADLVEDLREELFDPDPAAEGIFVDHEEESEGAPSEGSSSSAEEGASPGEEGGSAEEGASPSEAAGAEVEGGGGAPAGGIPGPAPIAPDLGAVLSLSPDRSVCRADFPHGSIVAYGNTKNMVAQCNIAAQGGKCHLTRTLTSSRRAGQGRRLGLLLA